MPRTLVEARKFLQQRGQRWTRTRARILAAAVAQTGHFDAETLCLAVNRGSDLRVSRATVYRTLPLLAAGGLIAEVAGPRGLTRYERVTGRRHHDHLHCLACGTIIELASDELEALQEQECRRHGFAPVHHQLIITGYCRPCARRRPPDMAG